MSRGMSVRTVVVVLAAGLVLGLLALRLVDRPHAALDASAPSPVVEVRSAAEPRNPAGEALRVLHAWDARRADAWARGDAAALGRLYVDGSTAGSQDVSLLRRYAARGLVVRGLRMQVLSLRVLSATPDRLRLDVVDRLAGGVVSSGERLPRDAATRHTLELRRVGGGWRMASVSGPTPAAP